jgi:hypothetical protein
MPVSVGSCQERSWAQIVKGKDLPKKVIRPSERGSRQSPTCGELLVLLGHYGWVGNFEDEIDHQELERHAGRVYVSRDDLAKGSCMPKVGDKVDFFLYLDDQGLGAEDCRIAGCPATEALEMRAEAQEFVPSLDHDDLHYESDSDFEDDFETLNPEADEFVPLGTMNPHAAEFAMPSKPLVSSGNRRDSFTVNASHFYDSDEDSDSDSESDAELWPRRHLRPKMRFRKSSGSDGSTSAGSDSDDVPMPPGLAPPGLERASEEIPVVEPPPGLGFPTGPPPGLAF